MGAQVQCFAKPDATWNGVDEILPEAGKVVKYRTINYQMLGYIDVTGQWIATDGTPELERVAAWREIAEPVLNWPERSE